MEGREKRKEMCTNRKKGRQTAMERKVKKIKEQENVRNKGEKIMNEGYESSREKDIKKIKWKGKDNDRRIPRKVTKKQ